MDQLKVSIRTKASDVSLKQKLNGDDHGRTMWINRW